MSFIYLGEIDEDELRSGYREDFESKNLIGPGPEESEKNMKKMMLGLTAAFCAAVTFGLESANIVG